MTDTRFGFRQEDGDRLATPHLRGGAPTPRFEFREAMAGAGAITSTAADMIRLVRAQLDPPANDLGRALAAAWQEHHRVKDGPLARICSGIGLGWLIAHDRHTRWHNGQTFGSSAVVLVSQKHDIGVVVLANTANPEIDQLGAQLIRMLAGKPEKPRRFEKRQEVAVAPETLARYAGAYRFAPGVSLTVTKRDGRLFARLTGQPEFEIYAENETLWFYKVVEATLTFEAEPGQPSHTVTLRQNDQTQTARRIDP